MIKFKTLMAHACNRYPECLVSKDFRIISLFFRDRPALLHDLKLRGICKIAKISTFAINYKSYVCYDSLSTN